MAAVSAVVLNLTGYGINVYAFLADACSLLAVALSLLAVRTVLFLAFATFLLLGLLFRTGTLVQGRQVDVSLYRNAGTCLGSRIQTEHTIHFGPNCRLFFLWFGRFLYCFDSFGLLHRFFFSRYGLFLYSHLLLFRGFLGRFRLGCGLCLLGRIQVDVPKDLRTFNLFYLHLDYFGLLLLF